MCACHPVNFLLLTCREIFEHMDDDKSGALDAGELSKGLSSLGYQVINGTLWCLLLSSASAGQISFGSSDSCF